jgi:hypothetical protein
MILNLNKYFLFGESLGFLNPHLIGIVYVILI